MGSERHGRADDRGHSPDPDHRRDRAPERTREDDHDHDHDHAPIGEGSGVSPESLRLERALRELLIDKGVIDAESIRRQIEVTESRTPAEGARVVARAWIDPTYRDWLLADAKSAIGTLTGLDLSGTPELRVLENTAARHHVVCCTLCSCYPRAVLGVPPSWYKNAEYRSRVVREPRAVLAEFGTELPAGVEIRVVDSTADLRYLVLPRRPPGTDTCTEAELAELVTRDTMIGVTLPRGAGDRSMTGQLSVAPPPGPRGPGDPSR
jgi:nitrile hydratase